MNCYWLLILSLWKERYVKSEMSTEGREFDLQIVELGSIPGIAYDFMRISKNKSWIRSQQWALITSGVFSNSPPICLCLWYAIILLMKLRTINLHITNRADSFCEFFFLALVYIHFIWSSLSSFWAHSFSFSVDLIISRHAADLQY